MDTNTSTPRPLRISDPSEWRLVCVITATGLEAYLRNLEDPTAEVECLLRESWGKTENILKELENAVYDNPQLLDDFSTDMAIVSERTLWVPREVMESSDDMCDSYFTELFGGEQDDIMRDYLGDKVCMYTLTPGLRAFLDRTFPGARIRNQQSVIVARFGDRIADMPRIYIDIREGEADFIAFEDTRLLTAVTHDWRSIEDIQYHLFNIMDVYGLDRRHIHISLSGLKDEKRRLTALLRNEVAFVMMTMVPGIATKAGMSLTASLLMRS